LHLLVLLAFLFLLWVAVVVAVVVRITAVMQEAVAVLGIKTTIRSAVMGTLL
tara:strand:- start:726 stop:881 length:156 start_codon:yes stop_codon:yes gene_type:complete